MKNHRESRTTSMINENIKDTQAEEIVETEVLTENKTAEENQQSQKVTKTAEDYIKERREAKEKHSYNQSSDQLDLKAKLDLMEKKLQKLDTDNKVLRITNDIKTAYPNLKPVALEKITNTITEKINLDEQDIKDIVENHIRKNFTEVTPAPAIKTIKVDDNETTAKKNESDNTRKAIAADLRNRFKNKNLVFED